MNAADGHPDFYAILGSCAPDFYEYLDFCVFPDLGVFPGFYVFPGFRLGVSLRFQISFHVHVGENLYHSATILLKQVCYHYKNCILP